MSLYLAGVSRYPLVETRLVVERLGSGYEGSQPRFLEIGGWGLGECEICRRREIYSCCAAVAPFRFTD